MRKRLAQWTRRARRDALALYLAARDPRVPRAARLLAAIAAAYALSPIDLIPDFIPVIGYLDDLVLLPLLVLLAVRLIPKEVMAALRAEADARLSRRVPRSTAAVIVIFTVWLALAAVLVRIFVEFADGGG